MKKTLLGAILALSLPVAAQAGELTARAGDGFFGASYEGSLLLMTTSADWLTNDGIGNIGSLGLGVQAPLGIAKLKAGGKLVYMDLKHQDNHYAAALGGGVDIPVGAFTLYGQGYFAPSGLASDGVDHYKEMRAGVRWDMTKMVSLDAGYQYSHMEGKNGNRSVSIADGLYVGAQLNF
ncbi:YfaZ family outer membrane protein [Iodobacter fluviatilis]|uniref:Outer membrane protein n=1 Tax=Iodobacter fluviatilis TaxID=537 RepID=A0A377SZV6_9NEIS|nr:YfaZ family outer membrane protein [Iodobacter fluviatilis]TCU83407.1 YfaZ precursor [Iodobacter fluviatilis]STR45876.1 outer membrane protein [Iodobacter fluviatilis]